MWDAREAGPVTDGEYVKQVRRYRPSSLLPLVAAASAAYSTEGSWKTSPDGRCTPWALADIARVALTGGRQHGAAAQPQDLLALLGLYSRLDDHYGHDAGRDPEALDRYLLRLTAEQFPYQYSFFTELARSAALFTQTTASRPAQCLRPGWEEDLLGVTVSEYVGIAQLLYGLAVGGRGRFDLAGLSDCGDEQLLARMPASTIAAVTERHFVTGRADFARADGVARNRPNDDLLRRYEHNQLRSTPLLRGFGRGLLAPVSQLILAKASPLGLFYTGMHRYDKAFADDLGDLFEAYVGRQLDLLPDAVVHPEVVYGPGNSRGVDWIVVTDDLVLLVEAKSTRPTWHLRLGTEERTTEIRKRLAKGFKQIERTGGLIASGQREFAGIPSDRPRRGLLVTMEPFHLAHTRAQRDHLPATTMPVTVCSISDLEQLVTIRGTRIDQLLLDHYRDSERKALPLRHSLQGHDHVDNSVLDTAWASYPWTRPRPAAAGRR